MTRRALLITRWAHPWDGPLPETFQEWARAGTTLRLRPLTPAAEPLSFLGLDPGRFHASEGGLRVAASGALPPSRSVHFALSMMSCHQGVAQRPLAVAPAEAHRVIATLSKLDTRRLTFIPQQGLEHALVWESGSLDHHTTEPDVVLGSDPYRHLPQGDGDVLLRRYIDDSVNLLTDLECNRVRLSEGLLPINLAWPWGAGFRPELPQLALLRGQALAYKGADIRLRGACSLVGYASVGAFEASTSGVAVLRADSAAEGPERLLANVERDLEALVPPFSVLVLFTGDGGGLGLLYDSERPVDNPSGWHPELFEDERIPLVATHEVIAEFFS